MRDEDYFTIVGALLYMRDHGAISDEEYASAYNAVNLVIGLPDTKV